MPNMTRPTREVLACFLKHPDEEMWGELIHRTTGVGKGTMYPMLQRLEEEGWLTSRWEERPTGRAGRLRRYYKLTGQGQVVARQEAAVARSRT